MATMPNKYTGKSYLPGDNGGIGNRAWDRRLSGAVDDMACGIDTCPNCGWRWGEGDEGLTLFCECYEK